MPEFRLIADYGDLCGEGPWWDTSEQCLFWTDLLSARFYRYDWRSHRHWVVSSGIEVCGFVRNQYGGFVIGNSQGLWLWDGARRLDLLASQVDGVRCSMNDCIADPYGRVFAGIQYYNPEAPYPLGYLLRLDCDGSASIVDEGFHLANGLAFSADYRHFYAADSITRTIYRYEYSTVDGRISSKRVLVEIPIDEGVPDGMTTDSEGFLWCAHWYGSSVSRFDADGKVERKLATPAKQTSSLMFGGPELSHLFVTSAAHAEPGPVPPGYDARVGNLGGGLYCAYLEIQGRPELSAKIRRREVPSPSQS